MKTLLPFLLLATACSRPAVESPRALQRHAEQVFAGRLGALEDRQAAQQRAIDARLDQLAHDMRALRLSLARPK